MRLALPLCSAGFAMIMVLSPGWAQETGEILQAKMCTAEIIALLREQTVPIPSHVNTCYSLVAPDYGISVAAVYRLKDGKIQAVEGSGGVSPADADANFRQREAVYAQGWYASIVADSFG